jgi:hypothetical protein
MAGKIIRRVTSLLNKSSWNTTTGDDNTQKLQLEIWAMIIRYLDPKSQVSMILVSKFFLKLKPWIVFYNSKCVEYKNLGNFPQAYRDISVTQKQFLSNFFETHIVNTLRIVNCNPKELCWDHIPSNIEIMLHIGNHAYEGIPQARLTQITKLILDVNCVDMDFRILTNLRTLYLYNQHFVKVNTLMLPASVKTLLINNFDKIPNTNISEIKLSSIELSHIRHDFTQEVWSGIKSIQTNTFKLDGYNFERFTSLETLITPLYIVGSLPKSLITLKVGDVHNDDGNSPGWFRDNRNLSIKQASMRLHTMIEQTNVTELRLPKSYIGPIPRIAYLEDLEMPSAINGSYIFPEFHLSNTKLKSLKIVNADDDSYPRITLNCPPTLRVLDTSDVFLHTLRNGDNIETLNVSSHYVSFSRMKLISLTCCVMSNVRLPKTLKSLTITEITGNPYTLSRYEYYSVDLRKLVSLRKVEIRDKYLPGLKLNKEQKNGRLVISRYLPGNAK